MDAKRKSGEVRVDAGSSISTLFLDIGGVLLSNGWDAELRRKAAGKFDIDLEELESRHIECFDAYEKGNISLDAYLEETVFFKKRSFSREVFEHFIFSEVRPNRPMIELAGNLKKVCRLKTVALSNEGRELAIRRIRQFRLGYFIDFFVVSSFVHLRKPDPAIYRLALDLTGEEARHCLYIDDRRENIESALTLGINAIEHRNYESTRKRLEERDLYPGGDFKGGTLVV